MLIQRKNANLVAEIVDRVLLRGNLPFVLPCEPLAFSKLVWFEHKENPMPKSTRKHVSKRGREKQANSQQVGFKPAYNPTHAKKSSGASTMDRARIVAAQAGASQAKQPAKKKRPVRKVVLTILLVLLVLALLAGAAFGLYVNQISNAIKVQDQEQAVAIDEMLTPVVSDEPFYMMVIGSDSRNDEFGQRSDTNIVARIDPTTNTVTLISIPRDTAIDIDGNVEKFNAAYNYNGAQGAIKAANELLGVQMSHYVEIDFSGLVDLIDEVGGVEVDVPMKIEDADAGGKLEAGEQTLNGEQALVFARSRSYTTGDFQRSANQRLLVEAFIEKVLSMPPADIPGLVKQAAKCITTDMSLTDIIGYIQKFQDADGLTIYSAMIPSTTADSDGVSYVVCDVEALKEMMAVVNEGGDPSTVVTDNTITSSEEAEALGESGIPIYVETDIANGTIQAEEGDQASEGEWMAPETEQF